MKEKKPKIVYLDIENTPNIAYVWGKYQQDVIDFVDEWHIMSFAYKFDGGTTKVRCLADYDTYKVDKDDDGELVRDLWLILDRADIVIGHNIDRFDLRKIQTRFLYHKLSMPSSFKTVDTLKIARKMFLMNSNKLDHIAKYLGIGRKVDTGGFDLWLKCMAGNKKAWSLMKKYNAQDVELAEMVYKELLPYITNHPNLNLFTGKSESCPSCGGTHLQKRGTSITKTLAYQRYQCQDCGSWSTGERIERDKPILK